MLPVHALKHGVELESKSPTSPMPAGVNRDEPPGSPISATGPVGSDQEKQEKLSRLHDIFHYRTSTLSTTSQGRATPALAPSNRSPPA
jgi:cytoskeleton-associated protein 5